jgi:hypothetical protein
METVAKIMAAILSGALLGVGVYLGGVLACRHINKHIRFRINIYNYVVNKDGKKECQVLVERKDNKEEVTK